MKTVKNKHIILFAVLLTTCFGLLGCEIFETPRYCEVQVGESFGMGRDGGYWKLPQNYCMDVWFTQGCFLLKLDVLQQEDEFADIYGELEPILGGYYVFGYYTDEDLVLCEEVSKREYRYYSFNFETQEVKEYSNEEEVFSKFQFTKEEWHNLCSTYDELEKGNNSPPRKQWIEEYMK